MTEFTIGNATVRIHGSTNPDQIKAATVKFLKKAEEQRKRVQREAREKAYTATEKGHAAMET